MILHKIHAQRIVLTETFQVDPIIQKLPPARKDIKELPKVQAKENDIKMLIVRFRMEEDNKSYGRKGSMRLWLKLMFWSMVKLLKLTRMSLDHLAKGIWNRKEEFLERNFNGCGTIVTN